MAGARGTPTWGTRKRRTPSRCSGTICSAACATQSEPGTSISTARGPKTAKAIAVVSLLSSRALLGYHFRNRTRDPLKGRQGTSCSMAHFGSCYTVRSRFHAAIHESRFLRRTDRRRRIHCRVAGRLRRDFGRRVAERGSGAHVLFVVAGYARESGRRVRKQEFDGRRARRHPAVRGILEHHDRRRYSTLRRRLLGRRLSVLTDEHE